MILLHSEKPIFFVLLVHDFPPSSQGGHLAAINDVTEQVFLTSQAAQTSHPGDDVDFYIGLSAYIDITGSMSFNWSSGEPVTFTAWGPGEPCTSIWSTFY